MRWEVTAGFAPGGASLTVSAVRRRAMDFQRSVNCVTSARTPSNDGISARYVRHDRVMTPIWSYVLAAFGITGILVARKRPDIGWWFNIAAQVPWTVYAVTTGQWGFLASGVCYTTGYVLLLRQARSARRRKLTQGTCRCDARKPQLDEQADAGEGPAGGAPALSQVLRVQGRALAGRAGKGQVPVRVVRHRRFRVGAIAR